MENPIIYWMIWGYPYVWKHPNICVVNIQISFGSWFPPSRMPITTCPPSISMEVLNHFLNLSVVPGWRIWVFKWRAKMLKPQAWRSDAFWGYTVARYREGFFQDRELEHKLWWYFTGMGLYNRGKNTGGKVRRHPVFWSFWNRSTFLDEQLNDRATSIAG